MKYLVRTLPLHKKTIDSMGRKSTQIFTEGSEVDLSESEYHQYKHLVESPDQCKSRVKNTKEKAQ